MRLPIASKAMAAIAHSVTGEKSSIWPSFFLLSSFCSLSLNASFDFEIDQWNRAYRGTGMALGGWLGGFLFEVSCAGPQA